MNQAIKDTWIAALRSGEFEQGTQHLKNGNAYCCLGVLCEVFRRETGEGAWDTDLFEYNQLSHDQMPPETVTEWAGLDRDLSIAVARLNDNGHTFEQIAEIIEREA